MRSVKSILACYLIPIGICLLVGFSGSWFTHQSLHIWYPLLIKPSFTPPNWVFPIAWTILYLLMGWALGSIVSQEISTRNKLFVSLVFGVQLFLNFLWSFLFFYLQNPQLALIDLTFLWVAIGFTIWVFRAYSNLAPILMLPYWAWVSFAWLLNWSIWTLNR